jgi:hypothetical protein
MIFTFWFAASGLGLLTLDMVPHGKSEGALYANYSQMQESDAPLTFFFQIGKGR